MNLMHLLTATDYSLQKFERSNQDTCMVQRPNVFEGEWVQPGDLLADCSASKGGELALGQNVLIAYMPWEGYNYEDAILISQRLVFEDLYTSIHIEKYQTETNMTKYGYEEITRELPEIPKKSLRDLDPQGIVRVGASVSEGDILVGKVTPIEKKYKSPYQKLLYTILEKELSPVRDTSLRAPKGLKAKVIERKIFQKLSFQGSSEARLRLKQQQIIHLYLAEKRRIQVGDKMAGRHGNKGIVSQILPIQDMPYLPDGSIVDIVLNPLGVPSRMNVGQIYECLLGLAAKYLGQCFRVRPFDELYGPETSRTLTFASLYKARLKTGHKWLFNPKSPGKIKIFDGRTGNTFDQTITVGISYILKLVHLVDDKLHARSSGPYSLVTQQPLRGRSKFGGQRLGEMEVWALEGYGAAFTLLEMLTIKSDDITGRMTLWSNLILHHPIYIGTPESFKVLICELQALCLDIGLFKFSDVATANYGQGFSSVQQLMKLP
uniref:DNA-directed RNA polymerase n=1 Tax=Raphidocelis subcapitata TaxID=307507 RepID=A0A2Z6FBL1_9CHLO|nr:DNA-directed RNA polymerase subunit beta fragment b [Raphidocelis subcapitata]